MLTAPYAVFALLANVVVSSSDPEILLALLKYAGVVVFGLFLMIVFYSLLVSIFAKKNPFWFLKQLSPAQLLAFSTSSSAATLPVTMERVEEHIGVDKEVSSFVLPVGATVNMDGTSLYQGIAAVFIAQALSFDLPLTAQLTYDCLNRAFSFYWNSSCTGSGNGDVGHCFGICTISAG